MTQQEQRPAVVVWHLANEVWHDNSPNEKHQFVGDEAAAAIIEADRAATRAAVVAEICEWLRGEEHGRYCIHKITQRFGGRDDQP